MVSSHILLPMPFMVCLTYLMPVVGILLMVYGGKTAKVINAILAMRLAERTLKKTTESFVKNT